MPARFRHNTAPVIALPSQHALPPRSAWDIQRAVIFALALRELRARAGGRWLGLLWLLFEPLMHMGVLLAMFTYIRHFSRPGLEVPVFLIVGIVPFFLFRSVALRVGDSIPANRGLFNYRQVKPADTLVARALVETMLHLGVLLALLTGLGWVGYQWWPVRPIEFIGVLALLLSFSLGVALVIAVGTLRRPKVRAMVGVLFFPLYLLSGVIFPVQSLPPGVRAWLAWNPLLHFVDLARSNFIANYHPLPEVYFGYPAAWTLSALALGLALYRVDRHRLRARD